MKDWKKEVIGLPVSSQRAIFLHFLGARWSKNSNGCFVDLSTASPESIDLAKKDLRRFQTKSQEYDSIQRQHRTHVDQHVADEPEVDLAPREEDVVHVNLTLPAPDRPVAASGCATRRFLRQRKYHGDDLDGTETWDGAETWGGAETWSGAVPI